jgi:hypothetical protein
VFKQTAKQDLSSACKQTAKQNASTCTYVRTYGLTKNHSPLGCYLTFGDAREGATENA